jgi:hypothetical protein
MAPVSVLRRTGTVVVPEGIKQIEGKNNETAGNFAPAARMLGETQRE